MANHSSDSRRQAPGSPAARSSLPDRIPGIRLAFSLVGILVLAACAAPALATTKGLNQIVTPDLQPAGLLSVSYQQQDPGIGNPSQLQFELGLHRRFEVAVFQGLAPGEFVLNTEVGLVQKPRYLLSAGFSGWNTRGGPPLAYIEGGYNRGASRFTAGATRVGNQWESILGWGYQANPRTALQIDYQSGQGNSATAGFTYAVTPSLSFNPAIYYTNDSPHHLLGYAVLTWNIQLWKA